MNELLFYSLLTALAYYFLVYAKPATSPKLTQGQSTQTDPLTETSPETTQQLDALLQDQAQKQLTIQGLNQSYEKLETKKNQQIGDLQKQISTLKTETKQQITQLTQTQSQEQKALEKTLDQLIKVISDLNKELN